MSTGWIPNALHIKWSIARMKKIVLTWAELAEPDKDYILRRIRDEEPRVFWKIANEKPAYLQRRD